MLSAETASGLYPLEAVRMMSTIAVEAESFAINRPLQEPPLGFQPSHAQIIAEAAYHCALSASVKAIVVFTTSGGTAQLIARFRPHIPIIAFCERRKRRANSR